MLFSSLIVDPLAVLSVVSSRGKSGEPDWGFLERSPLQVASGQVLRPLVGGRV